MPRKKEEQTASKVLMVRPAHFGFNEETADSNAFQRKPGETDLETVRTNAVSEFDSMVEVLRTHGIEVLVMEDTPWPVKPDAVFPNNWFSTHRDGTIVTYPMFSPLRRLERREDILQHLQHKYLVSRKIRLEEYESSDQFLEGTGSMVFDRSNRKVYACRSVRTSEYLLDRFCHLMGYEPMLFHAVDNQGTPVYHTNVMLSVADTFSIICLDMIPDQKERHLLCESLSQTGKQILEITADQVRSFAGNMLQLRDAQGKTFLVMSATAHRSLSPRQLSEIRRHTEILPISIPTIETYGGGSVRCMLAEVCLPALGRGD
ncbi:MAG: hypothetical protein RLY31_3128 [Bacteroidota bacterium]|jgi:hypothetical protein